MGRGQARGRRGECCRDGRGNFVFTVSAVSVDGMDEAAVGAATASPATGYTAVSVAAVAEEAAVVVVFIRRHLSDAIIVTITWRIFPI